MRTLERAWRAGKSEWKAHVTSVLGTAVAFLCLAFALLSTANLEQLQDRWEHAGRLSVYLSLSASEEDVSKLSRALESSEGVASATFVSSERARADLLTDLDSPLLEALPTEAFPPSIEVTLTREAAIGQRGATIAAALGQMPAVESIESYGGWVQRIGQLVSSARLVLWVLSAIVFLSVVAVVASTTQLSLQRRREEVEVLRFVGATTSYVRGPFLLEGAFQGAFGAVVALVLSAAAFAWLRRLFADQFALLMGGQPSFLPWTFCVALLAIGAALGAGASYLTLRRAFVS